MPTPDPAATILALRPSLEGFEVLMVHRNSRGFFGDIVVFPGGKVEDIDMSEGLTEPDDLSHRRAGIREFAEETRILLSEDGPIRAPQVRDHDYYRWLEEEDVSAGVDRLVLVSRWVTPETALRRFDTRFYVASCLEAPEVVIDPEELIWHQWVTPQVGLQNHDNDGWAMFRPTLAHLRWLARCDSIDEVIRSAEGAEARTLAHPRLVEDGSLLPIHMPGDLP